MRRPLAVLGILLLVAALIGGGFLAFDRLAGDEEAAPIIDKPQLGTATILQTDLIERETYPAVLRFAEPDVISTALAGTVTGLPTEGGSPAPGDVLVEIDGLPVFLMTGTRPMWRTLALPLDGSELSGSDVAQLEASLLGMGYPTLRDDDEEVPDISIADEVFDEDTVRLIEDWRADMGLPEGGFVELGRIVFLDHPIRIARTLTDVGAFVAPGTPVLEVSAPDQEVFLQLDVSKREMVEVDDAVEVTLPDDTVAAATIASIGSVVSYFDEDSPGVIAISIVLDDAAAATSFDESPVDVEIVSNQVLGALAVPVNALLALAEGGYALEVDRSGVVSLVAVETGIFVDGLVEVTGAISAGDTIVVPR